VEQSDARAAKSTYTAPKVFSSQRASKLYQSAQEAANRADRYAFRDRRNKKRQFRRLWIQRIGAGARNAGMSYSQLMHGLKAAGLELDRKILSDIAIQDPAHFTALCEQAKAAAPPKPKKVHIKKS
jgi:large subunit ribosomal protein L20